VGGSPSRTKRLGHRGHAAPPGARGRPGPRRCRSPARPQRNPRMRVEARPLRTDRLTTMTSSSETDTGWGGAPVPRAAACARGVAGGLSASDREGRDDPRRGERRRLPLRARSASGAQARVRGDRRAGRPRRRARSPGRGGAREFANPAITVTSMRSGSGSTSTRGIGPRDAGLPPCARSRPPRRPTRVYRDRRGRAMGRDPFAFRPLRPDRMIVLLVWLTALRSASSAMCA